ncbi:metallophosphoesterase family protein [Phenylobacterium deserti]|uniref:Metallophosphoesterase n=1 Tax=Phenylobacterium deserti TaxID=1914756 RepID=A0A328ADR3_9CAUL|nr:metallophosphoesterase [Phenylobacterium deserti]RAK52789.1 metallophosphoesterase [Phenylobacterium deserti]
MAFRLAHISDLHLPPPPGAGGRDQPLKRRLSRFAWRRKGRTHDPAVLAQLVADVKAHAPDHLAITGDLTNFSTNEEFEAARRWLDGLGPSADVTVSPGNHDALVGRADAARFDPWRPWLGDEAATAFPYVRRRGPVAVINLCSALPTAPHLAQGELGPEQLDRLARLLPELKGEGLFRLLLIHHPPVNGVVSRRKSLRDGETLRAVLREAGAELVLHGHAHTAAVGSAPGPRGPIPVLGVPSASSVEGHHEAARWHGFDIETRDGGWDVRVTARGLSGGTIGELGRYRLRVG